MEAKEHKTPPTLTRTLNYRAEYFPKPEREFMICVGAGNIARVQFAFVPLKTVRANKSTTDQANEC